jgi:hypothetical protein
MDCVIPFLLRKERLDRVDNDIFSLASWWKGGGEYYQ